MSQTQDRMARIYTAHCRRVASYIARHVRRDHRADIEDLTQETFIRAWRGLSSVQVDDEHLSGWLSTIARRVVADFYRRSTAAREVPVADDDQVWDATAMDAANADVPASRGLLDAVDELPPVVREVVELRVVNGMPSRLVAEVTHHSRRTVYRLAAAGVAELRSRTEVAA